MAIFAVPKSTRLLFLDAHNRDAREVSLVRRSLLEWAAFETEVKVECRAFDVTLQLLAETLIKCNCNQPYTRRRRLKVSLASSRECR